MIMKSNYQSTLNEHLENCRPKCKTHTQERQLTFFCILQLIYKETKPTGFFKTETEPNLKNPFRTSLISASQDACSTVPYYLINHFLPTLLSQQSSCGVQQNNKAQSRVKIVTAADTESQQMLVQYWWDTYKYNGKYQMYYKCSLVQNATVKFVSLKLKHGMTEKKTYLLLPQTVCLIYFIILQIKRFTTNIFHYIINFCHDKTSSEYINCTFRHI